MEYSPVDQFTFSMSTDDGFEMKIDCDIHHGSFHYDFANVSILHMRTICLGNRKRPSIRDPFFSGDIHYFHDSLFHDLDYDDIADIAHSLVTDERVYFYRDMISKKVLPLPWFLCHYKKFKDMENVFMTYIFKNINRLIGD